MSYYLNIKTMPGTAYAQTLDVVSIRVQLPLMCNTALHVGHVCVTRSKPVSRNWMFLHLSISVRA